MYLILHTAIGSSL